MPSDTSSPRRAEAERLIGLARALLNEPGEQMAVHYLDHAVAALRDAAAPSAFSSPSKAPAQDHG